MHIIIYCMYNESSECCRDISIGIKIGMHCEVLYDK